MSKTPDIDQIEQAVCEADEPEPPSFMDKLKSSLTRKKESTHPSLELTEQELQQNQTAREMFEEFQLRRRETERTNPIYANPATGELYPSRAMREIQQLDPRLHPYMNAAAAGIFQQYSPGNMPMVLTSGSFYSNPTPEISLNAPGQATTDFFLQDREHPQEEQQDLPEGVRQRSPANFRTIPSEAFRMGQPIPAHHASPDTYEDDVRFGIILCVPREWMHRYIYGSRMGNARTEVETHDTFANALALYWTRARQVDAFPENVRVNVGLSPATDCIEVCINANAWCPGLAPVFMGDNLPKKLMDGRIVQDVRNAYNSVHQVSRTGPQ